MPLRVRRALRLLVGCGLAAAPCAQAAVPLEVYGRLPRLEHIALSPDGTRVAFVRTHGEERVLAIMALATGQVIASLRAGDEKLRGIEWADDTHVMIETSVTGVLHGNLFRQHQLSEWFQMQVYDLTSGKLIMIPRNIGSADLALLNVIGSLAVRRVKARAARWSRRRATSRRAVIGASSSPAGGARSKPLRAPSSSMFRSSSGWGRLPTRCWCPASRTRSPCGGCCRSRTAR